MSFRTFMGSIGNAFKTGWNNGNIQKGMAITGMTAFGVGMTGAMIHDMKHSRSIFGSGCGCNSFGFGGGMNMFGCNPMSMGGFNMFGNNPMGMGGMNMFGNNPMAMGGFNMFGSNPMAMGGMNMFNGMNMLNGMGNMYGMGGYNQMGNMMAFQWGQQLAMQQQMQMMQQGAYMPGMNFNNNMFQIKEIDTLSFSNNRIETDTSGIKTDKGDAFDDETTALGKGERSDSVTIASDITNGREGDKVKYKESLLELAKSYLVKIGGEDGFIDEQEYIDNEMASLKEQYPNASEEQLETMIKNAFKQMDLNGDGDIDLNEMASSIATYDSAGSGTGKLDGKISKSDYSTALNSILKGTFGNENWKNYRTLFKDSVQE